MNNITIICNVEHDITPGVCALCERDELFKELQAWRARYQKYLCVFDAVMALTDAENQLSCIPPGPERDELQNTIYRVTHD